MPDLASGRRDALIPTTTTTPTPRDGYCLTGTYKSKDRHRYHQHPCSCSRYIPVHDSDPISGAVKEDELPRRNDVPLGIRDRQGRALEWASDSPCSLVQMFCPLAIARDKGLSLSAASPLPSNEALKTSVFTGSLLFAGLGPAAGGRSGSETATLTAAAGGGLDLPTPRGTQRRCMTRLNLRQLLREPLGRTRLAPGDHGRARSPRRLQQQPAAFALRLTPARRGPQGTFPAVPLRLHSASRGRGPLRLTGGTPGAGHPRGPTDSPLRPAPPLDGRRPGRGVRAPPGRTPSGP
ncbi:hypothetical protein P7K49_009422 [Saguinus oedipus]|uniref:Uncharacterized protein n=1 Tax=Saguinus oedipus TaxID=9490 RepID=A0ABQ9VJW6_SAGOE|nr:hypothetical protein P7K49_009422 [Saguinus oedipus]